MLVELTVENLAIIERAHLTLGPGFTALTGETGAGKSLLVDAIELALGRRADSGAVRAGARSASIQAVFDIGSRSDVLALCEELGVLTEDGLLIVQREVFSEGRSQSRIGGRLCPTGTLRRLGDALIDLHGQHEHQALLDPARHGEMLDAWIGAPAEEARTAVAEAYEALRDAKRSLDAVRQGRRDREQRLDLLRFQIAEIERVAPTVGEHAQVEAQLARLKNAARLREATAAAEESIAGEGGALDALRAALARVGEATRIDPGAQPIEQSWAEALVHLDDGLAQLRHYQDTLDADPEVLEQTAARWDELNTLRRKYGDDEEAVLAFVERARAEHAALTDQEASEELWATQVEACDRELQRTVAHLTNLRAKSTEPFAAAVATHLRDLAMDRAQFAVELHPAEVGPNGAETAEFFFTANLGEPLRPLARVASGGEVSRVMLAIKSVMAGQLGVPSLVFDEVDAGLGGRAASAVAQKIADLATRYQILVISHAPQLAARATSHIHVSKSETAEGRVTVIARRLDESERVEEIARMLSGAQITDGAVAGAKELMGLDSVR